MTSVVPLDEIQRYISSGIALLPQVRHDFLLALQTKERTTKEVCLAPSAILELYHLRLIQKVTTRSQYERRAA